MLTLRALLFTVTLLLSSMTPTAYASMQPFTATYDVIVGGLHIGTATKTLTRLHGNQYRYVIKPKVFGIAKLLVKDTINMYCIFDIKANKLIPQQYYYQQIGGKSDKEINLVFSKQTVCNPKTKQCWKQRLGRIYDPLSLDIAYPLALKTRTQSQQYDVITGEKKQMEKTQFHIEGTENINVPAGHFKTIKVVMNEAGENRPTTLWLAKATQYTPVKIVQVRRKHKIVLEMSYYAEPGSHPQTSFNKHSPHKEIKNISNNALFNNRLSHRQA